MANEVIVVDGANVAWEEQTKDDKPKVSNIIAMRQALEKEGYDPLIIIDASLRHDIDDPNQLETLIDNQRIRQSPAGTEADYFVIQIAKQENAKIISNDMFEKYRHGDDGDWIWNHRTPFMIVDGQVQLYKEPEEE